MPKDVQRVHTVLIVRKNVNVIMRRLSVIQLTDSVSACLVTMVTGVMIDAALGGMGSSVPQSVLAVKTALHPVTIGQVCEFHVQKF